MHFKTNKHAPMQVLRADTTGLTIGGANFSNFKRLGEMFP